MICITDIYVLYNLIQGHPWHAKVAHVVLLNMPISPLLLVLEVCNVKPAYRKSWPGNLLMWSDLALGPSFMVKLEIGRICGQMLDVSTDKGQLT